jgi:hypothetical protein
MIASRLNSKGKSTTPQPAHTALNLRDGDVLQGEAQEALEAFNVFDKWEGEADRKAYENL